MIATTNLSAPENQTTAGTVVATDQDVPADTFTWSLTGGGADAGRFTINSATGALTFDTPPDLEAPGDANGDNVYEVEVRVNDGTANTTKLITVTVSDSNDAPVITTTNLNVAENQTSGGTVVATDQDLPADTFTWSLTGSAADAGLFTINSATGALTFNTALDFESPGDANGDNVYEVEVRVFDGTVNATKLITVTVSDVNDAPVITSEIFFIFWNQTNAGTVVATDQDAPADTLTWSLTGNGADDWLFTINSVTGALTFNTLPPHPLDANSDNIYDVEVRVNDGTVSTTKLISVVLNFSPP